MVKKNKKTAAATELCSYKYKRVESHFVSTDDCKNKPDFQLNFVYNL